MSDFLGRTKSAAVVLDADAPDFEKAALEAEKYFRERGISLQIKAVHRGGCFFVRRRHELFISLLPFENFCLSLEARRSRAIFKAGRFRLGRSEVFDLVVSDNPSAPAAQTAVFKQITQILQNLK